MTFDDPTDELIAYVEGQLSPEQRSAFELRLRQSPALQEQLAGLRQVDESLKHGFAAPGFVKIDLVAARAQAAARASGGRSWKRWGGIVATAAAAAILIMLAVQSGVLTSSGRRPVTVAEVYNAQVANGFVPDKVCKDDAEFIEYSKSAFGMPLLAQSDSTVQIVGWIYTSTSVYNDLGLSGDARIILARANGRDVLLLIDPHPASGPDREAAAKQKLNVFETRLGSVAIFEVTPLDKPVASARFKAM